MEQGIAEPITGDSKIMHVESSLPALAETPQQTKGASRTAESNTNGQSSSSTNASPSSMFSPRSAAAMALSSISQQNNSNSNDNEHEKLAPQTLSNAPSASATPPEATPVALSFQAPTDPSLKKQNPRPQQQNHHQQQPPLPPSFYGTLPWQPPTNTNVWQTPLHDPRMMPPPPSSGFATHPPPPPPPHQQTQHQGPFYHPPPHGAPPHGQRRGAPPPHSLVTPTPKKARTTSYSRKKKSLGVLAETFCNRFATQPPKTDIVIDGLAKELGVERRRIYDVVNILESIKLVVKKHKNTYCWMGSHHLPQMFAMLQQEGIANYPEEAIKHGLRESSNSTAAGSSQAFSAAPQAAAGKKEYKSLSRLSQHFLQVFLVGNESTSLPEASDLIHGGTTFEDLAALGSKTSSSSSPSSSSSSPTDTAVLPQDPKKLQQAAARGLKTKIRRLYDIANVFMSVGILSKAPPSSSDSAVSSSAVSSKKNDTTKRPLYEWAFTISPKELLAVYDTMPDYMKQQKTPFRREEPSSSTTICSSNSTDANANHAIDKEEEEEGSRYPGGGTTTPVALAAAAAPAVSASTTTLVSTNHHHHHHHRESSSTELQLLPLPPVVPDTTTACFLANIHATGGAVDDNGMGSAGNGGGGGDSSSNSSAGGGGPRRVSLQHEADVFLEDNTAAFL